MLAKLRDLSANDSNEVTRINAYRILTRQANDPKLADTLAVPTDAEYETKVEAEIEAQTAKVAPQKRASTGVPKPAEISCSTLSEAINALRLKRYEPAMKFFEQLVRQRFGGKKFHSTLSYTPGIT